jgi:hypothetical protein
LTYCNELIDEVSVWGGKRRRDCLDSLTGALICQWLWRTILIHSPPHDITELVMRYATCHTSAAGFRFIRKDIALLANKLENGEESGGFL